MWLCICKLTFTAIGGLGLGLADNVIEAYNFLALNYAAGDEIFLFGFSRGAYTARALAGLVSAAGVLDRGSLERSRGLYNAYQEGKVAAYQAEYSLYANRVDARIRVVGCWDTVGSLGIPQTWLTWFTQANKHDEFFDTNLSDSETPSLTLAFVPVRFILTWYAYY